MKSWEFIRNTISVSALVCMFALLATAQRSVESGNDNRQSLMAVPVPIRISGNPTCATLNASNDPAFSRIVVDWGLKVERSGETPFSETFFFQNGASTQLEGGGGPVPGAFVDVNVAGNTLDWRSNLLISAVIVKGGPGANVYPYYPFSPGGFPTGDGTGLTTGGQYDISHFTFCYEGLVPSAAPATVSGRVVDSFGKGISSARISVLDAQTGTTRTVVTNPFGYYTVELEVSNFYILTISHKRYTFADNTHTFTLHEDLAGVDFVANP